MVDFAVQKLVASKQGDFWEWEYRLAADEGMTRLKADLHTHCADDPCDDIRYSAEMLIDAAAQLNVDVLAITCHRRRVWNERLSRYARQRDVLLIPGAELFIEQRHVVALNPDDAHLGATTFAELRAIGKGDAAFLAPHLFYGGASLGRLFEQNADVFDAVEHCTLWLPGINPNRRAVALAKRIGLPVMGTSDTHALPYCDSTFTYLDVEQPTVTGVIEAIRHGRVTCVTRPRPLGQVMAMAKTVLVESKRSLLGERD